MELGQTIIAGFQTGMDLADRWEETRRIVEDREMRAKAESDYQRVLEERVRPLRAVRQALWADISATQAEYFERMQSPQSGDLTELARLQALYDGKLRTHLATALEIHAAEEQAWHEYASTEMNPYRAEQAKRELSALVSAEQRFAGILEASAGGFGTMIEATEKERKLELDERNVAAYEKQVAGSGGGGGRGGSPLRQVEAGAIEQWREEGKSEAEILELLSKSKRAPKGSGGLTPNERSKVLRDVEEEVAAVSAIGNEEMIAPIAARLAEEYGVEIDPKVAAKDPALRDRLLQAERGRLLMERGEDLGDEDLIASGARRLDTARAKAAARGERAQAAAPTARDIIAKLKSVNTMNDDELATADRLLGQMARKSASEYARKHGSPVDPNVSPDQRAKKLLAQQRRVRQELEQRKAAAKSKVSAEDEALMDAAAGE